MPAALVPRHPGVLSALGMVRAEPLRALSRSLLTPLTRVTRRERAALFAELTRAGKASLREQGVPARALVVERTLDLRYRGQSYEIEVPEGPDPARAFHLAHERLYGYALPDREVELVCIRTRVRGRAEETAPRRPRPRPLPKRALLGVRRAVFDRPRRASVIDREELRPGHAFEGPALVEEYSGTTLVPPGWHALVTEGGHLLLRP